ncbi:hypothetical protein KCU59_g100, partial [Aureobasidium melanogenum]
MYTEASESLSMVVASLRAPLLTRLDSIHRIDPRSLVTTLLDAFIRPSKRDCVVVVSPRDIRSAAIGITTFDCAAVQPLLRLSHFDVCLQMPSPSNMFCFTHKLPQTRIATSKALIRSSKNFWLHSTVWRLHLSTTSSQTMAAQTILLTQVSS